MSNGRRQPGVNWDLGFNPSQYSAPQYGAPQYGASRGASAPPQMGLASLNPTALALQGAGGIAGAVASYLGGGQDRKDRKFGRAELRKQLGSDVYNPREIVGQKKLSYIANAAPLARSANRRLGLDSGRAQQELISQYASQEGDDLFALMVRKALVEAARDERIATQFAQAGR